MSKKNQTTQANDSSNSIVELSDENLQQVIGGNDDSNPLLQVGGVVFLGSDENLQQVIDRNDDSNPLLQIGSDGFFASVTV
jgi:bacteriocin-like protein